MKCLSSVLFLGMLLTSCAGGYQGEKLSNNPNKWPVGTTGIVETEGSTYVYTVTEATSRNPQTAYEKAEFDAQQQLIAFCKTHPDLRQDGYVQTTKKFPIGDDNKAKVIVRVKVEK